LPTLPTLFWDPGEIRAAWAVRYGQGMAEVPDETQLAAALKKRSKRFAIDVSWLCRQFPHSVDAMVVAKQLIKASTSTAANYRAACRTRSPADFVSRISVVAEEADESEFWLELTLESQISQGEKIRRLLKESGELTAIFTASRDTAKRNLKRAEGQ
jgi:four helix bundle protein